MNTREVADRLVSLCREGKNEVAPNELHADHIVSLEAQRPMLKVKGIEGVRGSNSWWFENHDVHSASVEVPYVNGDQFAVRFHFDITPKMTGDRTKMDEVGVYEVKNGKVVKETVMY